MEQKFDRIEWNVFFNALRIEARSILREIGSQADPERLIESVLKDLEALAPRPAGEEDRSEDEIWKQVRERLLTAGYATRPYCIRCGACCGKGSPALLVRDRDLFMDDVLRPEHVLTIRKGEMVHSSRTGDVAPAEREMIKIREVPETGACVFYNAEEKACVIYDERPLQCQAQECWNPDSFGEIDGEAPLERRALLAAAEDLWQVIERHDERCSFEEFGRAMARLSATKGSTVQDVLDILAFDTHVREFLTERFDLDPDTADFFLGRPLSDSLGHYGLKVERGDDGSYCLTTIDPAEPPEEAAEESPAVVVEE